MARWRSSRWPRQEAPLPLVDHQAGLIATRIRQIGVERILYGSDAAMTPSLEPRQAWATLRQLPLTGVHFGDVAGHWVQQEQPERVSALILDFLQRHSPRDGTGR